MKVNECLNHLTEYERYCWLMVAYPGKTTKEYNYFRDSEYHYKFIGCVWTAMAIMLVVSLCLIPISLPIGVLTGIATLTVGITFLLQDYRIDYNKRKQFFVDNDVPNFEEYDKEPIPSEMHFGRLRYLVYKFKSEKGYRLWMENMDFYPPEKFSNIE